MEQQSSNQFDRQQVQCEVERGLPFFSVKDRLRRSHIV